MPPGQPPEGWPSVPGIGETPDLSGQAEASKLAREVTPRVAAARTSAKVLLERNDMAVSVCCRRVGGNECRQAAPRGLVMKFQGRIHPGSDEARSSARGVRSAMLFRRGIAALCSMRRYGICFR